MKIGIDYHGVLNRDPAFFGAFLHAAKAKNVTIYILSGSPEDEVKNFLKTYDIPYDHIFSLLDYFDKQDMVQYFDDGSFFVPNELWNRAKTDFCAQNKINLHIDDSMLYGTYFKTPFCLYRAAQKMCTILKDDINIDFFGSPEQVLDEIIKIIKDF